MRTLRSAAMPCNPVTRSASCAPSRGAPDLLTLARDFRRCAGACRRRGEPELARRMERRARALAAGKTLADLARAGDVAARVAAEFYQSPESNAARQARDPIGPRTPDSVTRNRTAATRTGAKGDPS